MNLGHRIDTYRMCYSRDLCLFLNLGFTSSSDAILTPEELKEPEIRFLKWKNAEMLVETNLNNKKEMKESNFIVGR